MRPALALPQLGALALLAALSTSSCCCPRRTESACPDANLPRDDTLVMSLSGQAFFVSRRVELVDPVERQFCQMSLAGSSPLRSATNDKFSAVSIELYGSPGEHSAEEVLQMQCPALLTIPWPEHDWNVQRLESSWDGGKFSTLAARVVYVHTLPDGTSKRVYTLARGVFRDIAATPREEGKAYASTPGDQDTISQLTVGGVFQSGSHVALYDVSVDYTSGSPATLVEVFSTDLNTPGNVWNPASRIWVDTRPRSLHWSATQISGPFNPPTSVLIGVRITYANGTVDTGRKSFLNPSGAAQGKPLQ